MRARKRWGTRIAAAATVTLAAALAVVSAHARLVTRPPLGTPGRPTPTAPSLVPTPRPVPATATPEPPTGGLAACRAAIHAAGNRLANEVQGSLGSCLERGLACLLDAPDPLACCDDALPQCLPGLDRIDLMANRVRAVLSGAACAGVRLEGLFSLEGIGYDQALDACGRLQPPGVPFDRQGLGDCLRRLLLDDLVHRVMRFEMPRGPDAAACLALDELLPQVLLVDPSTCETGPIIGPTPTPSPTPSPSPVPTPSPIPTPTPTPGPGADDCQPALFGLCEDGVFNGCCSSSQHCAAVFGAAKRCVPGSPEPTPIVVPTPTPAPSGSPAAATPTPAGTPTVSPAPTPSLTPRPTPSPSPSPSPTPGPTPVPTASPTPGPTPPPGVTPSPTPTPSPSPPPSPTPTPVPTCSTATVTIFTSYVPPPEDVQGVNIAVAYPGPKLQRSGNPQNLSGVGGIFNFGDNDVTVPGDGFNDRLSVGLLAIPGDVPPGQFAAQTFLCRAGAAAPSPAEFSCTSDVSEENGLTVPSTCSVAIDLS